MARLRKTFKYFQGKITSLSYYGITLFTYNCFIQFEQCHLQQSCYVFYKVSRYFQYLSFKLKNKSKFILF